MGKNVDVGHNIFAHVRKAFGSVRIKLAFWQFSIWFCGTSFGALVYRECGGVRRAGEGVFGGLYFYCSEECFGVVLHVVSKAGDDGGCRRSIVEYDGVEVEVHVCCGGNVVKVEAMLRAMAHVACVSTEGFL